MNNNFYNDTEQEETAAKSPAGKLIVLAAVIIFLIAVGGIIPFIIAKNLIGDAIKQDTTQYNTSVTAVITENIVREESDEYNGNTRLGKVYTPVYEYEYNGKKYSVSGSVASSEKKYEVGQKVDVLISDVNPGKMYDPDYNPTKVFTDFGHSVSSKFIIILILPIILLTVIVIFIILLAVRSSKRTNAANAPQKTYEENDFDPNDDYRG